MESKNGIKERIQKTSKVLCVLIKIAQVGCYVGIGILTVGLVWVILNGNLDLLVLNGKVVVKSPFSSEFLANANTEEIVTIVAVTIAKTVMMLLLLHQAQTMFQDIHMNPSPFEKKHVASIRKIALFFFIMVIINVDSGNTVHDLSYSFDFTGIVAAAILWCISYIFEYGCLLQNESDETL